MTVVIGIQTRAGALVLTDSQGSTLTEEFHGSEKQAAGENFILASAGHALVCDSASEYLLRHSVGATGSEILEHLQRFIEQDVRDPMAAATEHVIVTCDDDLACELRTFRPTIFRTASDPQAFASCGSGAEFVERAYTSWTEFGVLPPAGSLLTLGAGFYVLHHLARAADRALTVDDQWLVGVMRKGRTYVIGDARYHGRLRWQRPEIREMWGDISAGFRKLVDLSASIHSSVRQSHVGLYDLFTGTIRPETAALINASAPSVGEQFAQLDGEFDQLLSRYDALAGRD